MEEKLENLIYYNRFMKKLGTVGTPHDSTKKMVMIENERNGRNARQISIFLYFMANVNDSIFNPTAHSNVDACCAINLLILPCTVHSCRAVK